MANAVLTNAKNTKNDEFYTQYYDIEKEINAYLEFNPNVFKNKVILCPCDDPEWSNFTRYFAQNFEKLKLKKLISTSYAFASKGIKGRYVVTTFERKKKIFDKNKVEIKGKNFTLAKDINGDNKINIDDLDYKYLDGDGDFRSEEVTKLRDEADIIVTNPPFSLFRDFVAWIMEAKKQFLIIGSMNAIGNKEIFPLVKENKMWLGNGFHAGNAYFSTPVNREYASGVYDKKTGLVKFRNVCWLTNLEHGRRHQELPLMTMKDNLKYNKKMKNKGVYEKYDNYNAIEVPFTDAIPSDYDGIMGVPISFLNKYNPEQFYILGSTQRGCHDEVPDTKKYDDYWEIRQNGKKTGSSGNKTNENANLVGNDGKKNYFTNKDGKIIQSAYQRIFIKHKKIKSKK